MRYLLFLIIIIPASFLAGCSKNLSPTTNEDSWPTPQIEVTSTEPLIGGQKDEHGCLGPAGYSWCPSKNKCLRTWEEACTLDQAVYNYLRDHVSELSPTKEVLGGKFYLTDLKMMSSSTAIVSYEDGHIALKANVVFSGDKDLNIKINKFEVVK